ncbi:tyrosine-type recombinase/integrase [Psychrobacillus antarcticus]|uniref:tyrosine-type recombinase/integrase n=1 Tax=Psychrobacillus antarcticus TaxID=2879115 RepID=UPI00240809D5|nr:tyrosine-type recombinase/integrase [Psychrobacillus antarcticus]
MEERKIKQFFESLNELPSYENVCQELINIKPKSFINFAVTPNIDFIDDFWDFKEFKRFSSEAGYYKFDFNQLDTTYKNYAKYMVLRELFNKHNRFNTVKSKFRVIVSFITSLTKHHIFYPELIDIPFLKDFLGSSLSERSLTDKKHAIKVFLSEIELRVPKINFSEIYKYLDIINRRKVRVEREKGKHKLIPINLHNGILSLAIKDIRNDKLNTTQRASACMIVLLAETGMRIGEFHILEVNKLEKISVKGETDFLHYLNFKTYKTVKEKDYKWTRSFITQNAFLAYKTLTEIFKKNRKSTYLFVKKDGTEVSRTFLRYLLVEFFYRHQDALMFDKIIDQELNQFSITSKRKFNILRFVPNDEIDKKIYYVTFHQYRVTLATILYNKGYQLDFIRQHMNHLTEDMTKHYIRLEELKKFNLNAIETLMKRSSQDGTKLITEIDESSSKYLQEELKSPEYIEDYENINNFIKMNKLNIFKDINEIISRLSRTENQIADMELGICGISFNKLCERNQYITSINDAYYLGTQLHTLDDLPHSEKRFQEKINIIIYNESLYKKNLKYRNEFERELKGIKKYIERKLEPELEMLKDEIAEVGFEETKHKYPKLSDIITNINDIEMEMKKWHKKTL